MDVMSEIKEVSLRNFIGWLSTNFKEFVKEGRETDPLRVFRVHKCNKSGEIMLEIKPQMMGKTFLKTPQEILDDASLLNSFSRKDIKGIAYLAYNKLPENQAKQYKIISQYFRHDREYEFVIQSDTNHEKKNYTLSELLEDKDILKSMDGSDGLKIGFIAGEQSILKESE